jgi:hypothetical protein
VEAGVGDTLYLRLSIDAAFLGVGDWEGEGVYVCMCVREKKTKGRWMNRCDMIEARTYS